jgi:subtilisin family serine protease
LLVFGFWLDFWGKSQMAKHLRMFSFGLAFWLASQASALTSNPKKIIVRFQDGLKHEEIQTLLQNQEVEKVEVLVPSLNLYSVTFKKSSVSSSFLKTFSNKSGLIRYAHPDHIVKLRQSPNDPELKAQWSLNGLSARGDIGTTQAWEIGTGGKDANGNEVVVAVVDGGLDVNHKDLQNNIWTNSGEIPGNGVDDDKNGYIDDVNGWNAVEENGTLAGNPTDMDFLHGTHVAGIVGAQGNNKLQVSGVNWNTKIMGVAGSSGETSVVARAYGYVIAQKKLWLESKGKKGANIVVTNSSFGVDRADCASTDFAAWNDLYNEMGKLGILSVVATSNSDVDVDTDGDVPSGCKSPYIISVTNTDSEDEKYKDGAGYGAKTIHLGAPGTDILSTVPGNKTKKLTGTSMATPHVTGAVALLQSVASKNFAKLYQSQPAEGAKLLKDILLKSVDPVSSLKGITISEGRLNVFKAADTISKY